MLSFYLYFMPFFHVLSHIVKKAIAKLETRDQLCLK